MPIVEQIAKDLTAAMKAQDAPRTSALRMAKAALKNREIDKKAPLEDAEAAKVLQGLVKQGEDSTQQFRQAGRGELADKEEAEAASGPPNVVDPFAGGYPVPPLPGQTLKEPERRPVAVGAPTGGTSGADPHTEEEPRG